MEDNKIEITLNEYLDFRHKLAEQSRGIIDMTWIEMFVEKLFLNYHSAYMQGRLDGMERTLFLFKECVNRGE